MKRFVAAAAAIAVAALFVSCQAVFTFSPLKAFAADPSTMSPSQQAAYAQQALASGDTTAMRNAYNAISSSTDPSTSLLAAELAFGASGATDVLTQALGVIASGGDVATLQSALNRVNLSLVTAGAQHIETADAANVPITDTQYAIAAAAIAASAAQLAGGYQNLSTLTSSDPGWSELQQAQGLANKISSPELSSALQGVM
ncbi:MAG TPA: hypothetical protein VMV68_01045 [Spirochaetia bacterium]|nr:hypothetical protein [Spirochaetia bacterium]